MAAPAQQIAPVRTVGRYALYDPVASGGMATVHLGRLLGPVGFARTVAIKRLHPQFASDPDFVSMFLDEARLAARIRHPNVVPTLDVVALEAELFLVMEYIQGDSLGRLLRTTLLAGKGIPVSYGCAILAGALHGLHAAHEARGERGEPLHIVHRDMSPQNVLVGTDGVARVLDFGVAKAAGRLQTTREGQLKGKMAYMAPEQLRAEGVDRRTDIYSAGVVLWEVLAGQRLFKGESDVEVFGKVLQGPVAKPSSITPGVPASVDEIVMKALSRDRDARFATAREMARAIEAAVALVAPSEIGEWVETTLAEMLAQRAETIARIEEASSSSQFVVPQAFRESPADLSAAMSPAGGADGGGGAIDITDALEMSPASGSTASAIRAALVSRVGKRTALIAGAATLVLFAVLLAIHSSSPDGSQASTPSTTPGPLPSAAIVTEVVAPPAPPTTASAAALPPPALPPPASAAAPPAPSPTSAAANPAPPTETRGTPPTAGAVAAPKKAHQPSLEGVLDSRK